MFLHYFIVKVFFIIISNVVTEGEEFYITKFNEHCSVA